MRNKKQSLIKQDKQFSIFYKLLDFNFLFVTQFSSHYQFSVQSYHNSLSPILDINQIMTSQIVNSFRVFYDTQEDKYYRINKQTGQVLPSFKSGKLFPKFNPDVTGSNYVARKYKSQNNFDPAVVQNPIKQTTLQNNSTQNLKKKMFIINEQNHSSTININHSKTQPKDLNSTQKDKQFSLLKRKKASAKFSQSNWQSKKNQFHTISSTLPKIRKQNSLSIIQSKNLNSAQTLTPLYTIRNRNSQTNADHSFAVSRIKKGNHDSTFLNSLVKVNIMESDSSVIQSRMNRQNFQQKLKRLSQMQETILLQSKINLEQQQIDKVKQKKNGHNSMVNFLLEQSHLSMKDSSLLNFSTITQNRLNNLISKVNIKQQLKNKQQQKQGLLELQKKCKISKNSKSIKNKSNSAKLPQNLQASSVALDIKQQQELKKVSNQRMKQKQAFLSFYPEYIFKQNPRLIQQQKDRRINFKKLQKLFLEINQKKFGKVYKKTTLNDNQLDTN